jgi:hypothetical protein
MDLKQRELQNLYLAHAASDRTAAGPDVLANVRRKFLTSAAAWEALAQMVEKSDVPDD